jgi:uncharacterized protein YqgC (DUF456 family)
MTWTDALVAVVIAVGVVGTVVPVLPGSVLVGGAVLVWAVITASPTGWVVLGVVAVLLGCGTVVKYAVPGRRLRTAGVPRSTLVIGGLLGVAGFFLVPVAGLPLGFVAGVFLAEWRRLGDSLAARAATVSAVRAVGLGVLIELCAATLAAAVWGVGVVLT